MNSLSEANIHPLIEFSDVKVWAQSIDGAPLLDEVSKHLGAVEKYHILPTEFQPHNRSIFTDQYQA